MLSQSYRVRRSTKSRVPSRHWKRASGSVHSSAEASVAVALTTIGAMDELVTAPGRSLGSCCRCRVRGGRGTGATRCHRGGRRSASIHRRKHQCARIARLERTLPIFVQGRAILAPILIAPWAPRLGRAATAGGEQMEVHEETSEQPPEEVPLEVLKQRAPIMFSRAPPARSSRRARSA